MQLKNVSNCFEMFTFLIENEEKWVKIEENWGNRLYYIMCMNIVRVYIIKL